MRWVQPQVKRLPKYIKNKYNINISDGVLKVTASRNGGILIYDAKTYTLNAGQTVAVAG